VKTAKISTVSGSKTHVFLAQPFSFRPSESGAVAFYLFLGLSD